MDIADHLKNRMEIAAEIVGSVEGRATPVVWRWNKFKRVEGIKVEAFRESGGEVLWQRKGDGYGRIRASNITPYGKIADRKDVDINLGEELIDSLTADALNYDGVVAVPINYDGTFRKLKGLEEAFDYGLTQSIETTIGIQIGSEAAQNKYTAELKLGFESRQDWHHQESSEDEQARSAGISPESPPKWDIRYKLDRYGQRKKLKSSGLCQVDHGIKIGKMKNGGWRGNKGEHGKTWPRWAAWDSFYEEFLPVIKGEGRRDLDLAMWFRLHPVNPEIIAELEKPLQIPWEHTTEPFDGATRLVQSQIVLRGPKPDPSA